MIFRTFNSEFNEVISKIGIFNKSFKDISRDYVKGNSILTSLFSGNNVTQTDIESVSII